MSDNWNPPPDDENGTDDGKQPPSSESSGRPKDGSGPGWWSEPSGPDQPWSDQGRQQGPGQQSPWQQAPAPGQQAPWETPQGQPPQGQQAQGQPPQGQQPPGQQPQGQPPQGQPPPAQQPPGQQGPGQQPPWQAPPPGQGQQGQPGQPAPWQQALPQGPAPGQQSPWQNAGPGQQPGRHSAPPPGQHGGQQGGQQGQQNWAQGSGQGEEHQTQNWPITPQPEQQQPPRPQGDGGQGWQHGGQQGPPRPQPGADVPTGWQFPPPQRGGRGGGGGGGGGGHPYSPLMSQIPIPQPPGPGRRRRRRRRMRALLIGGVALAVLLAATGVTLILSGGDEPSADPGTSTTPSETPSPTPTPTSTPSSSAPPASKPTTPPKPKEPTALELVTRNKVYTTGLLKGAAGCVEPNYRPTTYDAVRRYYNALVPCMNRAWYFALRKAKIKFRGPKVVVYAGVISTLCGPRRGDRAYYCAGNETIYMPWTVDNSNYKRNQAYGRAFMANTFAHEYGHHVQQLTGIMDASWKRQRAYKIPAGALQESRRRELQASCFGSVYIGSIKNVFPLRGDVLTMWRFTVDHSGDEYSNPRIRDHGSRITHGWWSRRGFNGMNPGLCNTWSASPTMTR